MSGILKLQMNVDLPGHLKGQTITVSSDTHGNPFDLYWRRRLRDGACEVMRSAIEKKEKAPRKSEKKGHQGQQSQQSQRSFES